MGLQLIFVVETDSKCKSDWIYIRDTIEWYYTYDRNHTKFTPVYMAGKHKYTKKEREIKCLVSEYSAAAKDNRSQVIYCFDCDDYDIDPKDRAFLCEVEQYCKRIGADLIWFCRDIEQVYLGEQVHTSQKKHKAASFRARKSIQSSDAEKLSFGKYHVSSSNILSVLDKYLERYR